MAWRYVYKNCEVSGLNNIPEDGKCLIVANHPMGPADAVAMYHNVYKKRKDAFFFANELFVYLLGAFDDMMAPVVWDKEKQIHTATKKTIERMRTFFLRKELGYCFHLEDYRNLLSLVWRKGLGKNSCKHCSEK